MAAVTDTATATINEQQQLSRRAAKKAKRKQQKAEKKRQALDAYISSSSGANMDTAGAKQHGISNSSNNNAN